jgi:hypothetical protein
MLPELPKETTEALRKFALSPEDVFAARSIDFRKAMDFLGEKFGVRPAFRGYDDAFPNAYAVPPEKPQRFPDGPDGTVLLGMRLVAEEMKRGTWSLVMGAGQPGQESLLLILAHEWAHILQFKRRVRDAWQMEPHADFLAGWFFALRFPGEFVAIRDLENAAKTMFDKGDQGFYDRPSHGKPDFRARMVRAGYQAGQQGLDLNAAFARGKKLAGLE